MSKYTTEVRFICESLAGYDESQGSDKVDEVIRLARTKIFDFSYPIFDASYKSVLESKILLHYYTREIGLETYGLWKNFLRMKMREIMPYYNKLYKSELYTFNPFYDVDLTIDRLDKRNETGKDTTKGTGTNKGDTWNYFNDTPQGGISGIATRKYLTDVRNITEDGHTTSNVTSNNKLNTIDDYLEHIKGKRGGQSYSKLLQELRDTFLNIDVMVINDLSDLFLNLW